MDSLWIVAAVSLAGSLWDYPNSLVQSVALGANASLLKVALRIHFTLLENRL